ncbi:glutaminase [Rothia aerolata]|uniref:Glutaminase n=1 Tax=Rothia aerolata TaxID=1812262 RepID=A0A917MQU4_9MICC|nr:glutaminase [Rothia aerolata]GGH58469.1 glutaminase [Rothia aerolata]
MKSPVTDYLEDLLTSTRDENSGELAAYIPELAKADPNKFAIALTTVDGRSYAVGDVDHEFSLQSISKPFAYALALADRGLSHVISKVGVEPSGEAFNELSVEEGTQRPDNPMINVGAIAIHSMLVSDSAGQQERIDHLLDFLSRLAGRQLHIDQSVFESEKETAQRNLAMAHMLKSFGLFEAEAHEVVEGYIAQCAIKVNVQDLSIMGATFANGGVQPITGEQTVDSIVARQVLSVMVSAGMYDGSGTWFAQVGIPAKSGVSGGVLGVLPSQLGIGVFSPRLDEKGNSVRSIEVFKQLSAQMGLHMMNAEAYSYEAVRLVRQVGSETVIELQGRLEFTNAEETLHRLENMKLECADLVVDLTRVSEANRVGRAMLLDGLNAIQDEGIQVSLLDPDNVLKMRGECEDDGIQVLSASSE